MGLMQLVGGRRRLRATLVADPVAPVRKA
jgi:hypothetical protein